MVVEGPIGERGRAQGPWRRDAPGVVHTQRDERVLARRAVERDHEAGDRTRGNEPGHSGFGGTRRERRDGLPRGDVRRAPADSFEQASRDERLDEWDRREVAPELLGEDREVGERRLPAQREVGDAEAGEVAPQVRVEAERLRGTDTRRRRLLGEERRRTRRGGPPGRR